MCDPEVVLSGEDHTNCIKHLLWNWCLFNITMFSCKHIYRPSRSASGEHTALLLLMSKWSDHYGDSSDMSNYLSAVSVHTSGLLMWGMSFYFPAREGWDDTTAQFSERSGSESRRERDWVSETSSAGTTEHNRRSVQGISISSHRDVLTCVLKVNMKSLN